MKKAAGITVVFMLFTNFLSSCSVSGGEAINARAFWGAEKHILFEINHSFVLFFLSPDWTL